MVIDIECCNCLSSESDSATDIELRPHTVKPGGNWFPELTNKGIYALNHTVCVLHPMDT